MECHEPKGARCVGLGLAGLGVDDRRKSAAAKRRQLNGLSQKGR